MALGLWGNGVYAPTDSVAVSIEVVSTRVGAAADREREPFSTGRRKSGTKMPPNPPPGKSLGAWSLAIRRRKHAVCLESLVTLVIRGLRITPLSRPARVVL